MNAWYDTGIAGPWGTFSLSFFAITASSLGELAKDASSERRLSFATLFAIVLCGAGLLTLIFFPFSKHLLSLSYILFTAGVASALLALFVLTREMLGLRLPIIGSLGRNALVLYMLHSVIGVVMQALLGDAASASMAWVVSFLVLGLCVAVAVLMDSKKLYVKL
jgi:predicted acyltransferase